MTSNIEDIVSEIKLNPKSEKGKLFKALLKRLKSKRSPQEKYTRAMRSPRYFGVSSKSFLFSDVVHDFDLYPAIQKKFIEAPISIQAALIYLREYDYSLYFIDYASILLNSESLKAIVVTRGGANVEGIPSRLKASKTFLNASEDFKKAASDTAYLSDPRGGELTELIVKITPPKACLFSSSLYILRSTHGEEIVLEVMKRLLKENLKLTIIQIAHLVKDWNNLKDYPIEWSIEFLESDSDESTRILS